MIKTKLFTLIELLITIVVIGVLAAIVIPNISNFKQESTTAAMQANIKNIETALTMYALENHGALPILGEPEIGLPEPLLLDQLHPDFLRSLPNVSGMKYWVDYSDKVWASSADSPVGVVYSTDGKLKWEDAENAVSFNIYKTETNNVTSKASNKKVILIKNVEGLVAELPKLGEGEFYLVNSVDGFGLESPPVKEGYQGNLIGSEMPETGISQGEKFPWPMEMEEVKWKNSIPAALTDENDNTFHTVKSNEDYLFEWQGDLANRVFQVRFSTGGGGNPNKHFIFLDKNGKEIPFINARTDEVYETFTTTEHLSARTVDFVVPRGATQFKIHGPQIIYLINAGFVKDLSLPYPVENVSSETTKESITLKWSPPTNASNFSKVAIYDGNKFLGYSTNGSFTINSLYSDSQYMYSIEPISVVGNRGPRVDHTNKTFRPEIVWRGLDNAKAFDSFENTHVTIAKDSIISWEGNLDNKQINFQYSSIGNVSTGPYIEFAFFDKEGNRLNAKAANDFNELASHRLHGGYNVQRKSVVVPKGATSIKFIDTYYEHKWYLHGINHGTSLELPSKLENIQTSATKNTISLKLNRPEDVTKVAVIRDGKFIAYTTEDTFTDISLYSNQTYKYTFETFNTSGNRTENGGTLTAQTLKPEIVWHGLDNANAFDGYLNTHVPIRIGESIAWEGDLDNRQITFTYERPGNTSTSPYLEFSFFDKNGNALPSREANTYTLSPTQRLYGGSNTLKKSYVVPEGATSLKIVNNYSITELRLFEITYGGSLELPSKLTNVVAKSADKSITFNFNRPADVTRVAVIRDGRFVAYTNNDTFTDNSLYSDQEYHYTFETFNSLGHRTPFGGNIVARTTRAEVVWRGLDNANGFDGNESTHVPIRVGETIKWEGNLDNKQITIAYERPGNTSTTPYLEFAFFNEEGKQLSSRTSTSTIETPTQKIHGGRNILKRSFIVPEGATSIKILNGSYITELRLYEITY